MTYLRLFQAGEEGWPPMKKQLLFEKPQIRSQSALVSSQCSERVYTYTYTLVRGILSSFQLGPHSTLALRRENLSGVKTSKP